VLNTVASRCWHDDDDDEGFGLHHGLGGGCWGVLGLVNVVLALGCLLKRRPDITMYNNLLSYILWGQSTLI